MKSRNLLQQPELGMLVKVHKKTFIDKQGRLRGS